jgi:hypothetical protein
MNMTSRFWKRPTAAALVLLSISGVAQADGNACSNGMLKGTYSFRVHGELLGILDATGGAHFFASPQLIDGVAVQTFNGNGSFTRKDYVQNSGRPRPGQANSSGFTEGETGPYTVNSDCTGTMTVNFPAASGSAQGTRIDFKIVVADEGRIIDGVVSSQFLAVGGPLVTPDGTNCYPGCDVLPQGGVEGIKVEGGQQH